MGRNEPHIVEGQGTAGVLGGPLGCVELCNVLYVPTMVHNLGITAGQVGFKWARDAAKQVPVELHWAHADNLARLMAVAPGVQEPYLYLAARCLSLLSRTGGSLL